MTAIDHTIEDLDQLAATYRFLALITELRARARAAAQGPQPTDAEHLEREAAFLSRQLPDCDRCVACGQERPSRVRRWCQYADV